MLGMKISYLTTDSKIGGAERVVLYLAEGVKREGSHPRIIALKEGGSLDEAARAISVPFTCHDMSKGGRLAATRRLVDELRSTSPDILHCHLFHANAMGLIAGRIARVPFIILTEHGLDVIGGSARNVMRVVYSRLADGIIAISESSGRKLRGFPFMPVKKVRVIHNGIPPIRINMSRRDILARIGLEVIPGDILVASLSHFRREKGVDIAIRAIAEPTCRALPVKLVLVGSGPLESELRELCDRLGVKDRVIFAGFRSDAADILSACDIFVLSSHEEGLPITLLEAAALGKASIASNVGGVPEVLDSGVSGFLVAAGDAPALSEAIARLAVDESLRIAWGRKLNENYRERFSVDSMIRHTMNYYREVMNESGR